MSIDSQLAEMRALAQSEGLNVVCELQESHSAKDSGQRPVYNQLLASIANDEYNAILTWAPDRLSRNAGDLGSIVDLMDQGKLLHIKTYSQTFSNNPNEKFLLMILCSQAKLENDNKSINVKRGIKTKCEMGWRPGVAPLGYMNRAFGGINDIIVDPERGEIVSEMFSKAAQGWSGRKLKEWLDEQGFQSRNGKPITLSSVLAMLINPFYYGEFQYPEGPGAKWYKGAHKPLISKDLFDQVQLRRGMQKGTWGAKPFAFRGLLQCGTCGAGVCGEDKFKKLKDGSVKRYIYYRCSKKKDYKCPEKYIGEEQLCLAILDYVEEQGADIDITPELKAKVDRYIAILETLKEYHGLVKSHNPSLSEYARYVFKRGTENEKRQLGVGVKKRFVFQAGKVYLENQLSREVM